MKIKNFMEISIFVYKGFFIVFVIIRMRGVILICNRKLFSFVVILGS